jgi:hypothetical protein
LNAARTARVKKEEIIMFADIRIGPPASYGSLTVFPLFCDETHPVDYLLSDEVMEAGTVTVGEVSQEGSVPNLVVENKGLHRALFLEGEELRGAKQNRILNTSVLVPTQTKLTIPVSCVEHRRWRRTSDFFMPSKTMSPYHLRHGLKSSVTHSLKDKLGHRSDQGLVWDEVRKQQDALAVESGTSALADTYDKYQQHLGEAQKALQYVPGACGLVVAIGSQIVTADLFDKPATCEKVWNRLLSGLVLDALTEVQAGCSPDSAQMNQFLHEVRIAAWTQTEAVGEGQEYRAEFDGKTASALLLDGALVHGSVVSGGA